MNQLVEFPTEDGTTVIFEVDSADMSEDLQLATQGEDKLIVRANRKFDAVIKSVAPVVNGIQNAFKEAAPDSVTVEFGIKMTGETSVVFAKGTAEANLNVKCPGAKATDVSTDEFHRMFARTNASGYRVVTGGAARRGRGMRRRRRYADRAGFVVRVLTVGSHEPVATGHSNTRPADQLSILDIHTVAAYSRNISSSSE